MKHLLSAAIVLLAGSAAAQAPAPWDAARWNPRASTSDFVLPIPCGGSLALREIDIPAGASPLDDRRVVLGSPEADQPYSEFQRSEFITGGFQASPQARRYWLGKYEVTRDQYAAVMQDTCPAATPEGRRPMAEVSWFDATRFSERLTIWLMANARAKLPTQDGAFGYLRLPTEAEWEYAARGGNAVSESEFLAPAPPMPEGAEAYIMAGARRTGNRAQAIGQLLPNPLGLHDMLGNVGEFVLEPYRLNRVGRPHGLAGGQIAKGGDFGSQPDDLRSSQRVELPPFDTSTGQPTRLPRVGFRVALAVVATTSLPQAERLKAAFTAEASSQQQDAQSAADDPQRAIALLRARTSDPALQAALQRVEAQMATDRRERADQQREITRSQIENMAALVWSSQQSSLRAVLIEQQLNTPGLRASFKKEELERFEMRIADFRQMAVTVLDAYLVTLRRMAENAPRNVATEQFVQVRRQFQIRKISSYNAYMDMIENHIRETQLGRPISPERAKNDIVVATEVANRRMRVP